MTDDRHFSRAAAKDKIGVNDMVLLAGWNVDEETMEASRPWSAWVQQYPPTHKKGENTTLAQGAETDDEGEGEGNKGWKLAEAGKGLALG